MFQQNVYVLLAVSTCCLLGSAFGAVPFPAPMLAKSVRTVEGSLPYGINCSEPKPRPCFLDLNPWCLQGVEQPAQGHCQLQEALCDMNMTLDASNRCFLPYPIACKEPRTCLKDAAPWCIVGESDPVLGHCGIQDAICDDDAVYDPNQSCV